MGNHAAATNGRQRKDFRNQVELAAKKGEKTQPPLLRITQKTKKSHQSVLAPSATTLDSPIIRGFDFSSASSANPPTLDGVMRAMATTGFQATALGQAVGELNRMLSWRLSDDLEEAAAKKAAAAAAGTAATAAEAAPNGGEATAGAAAAAASTSKENDPDDDDDSDDDKPDPTTVTAKIFLAFTSNLGSSGVRDTVRYLAQRRLVDVIVTTAGAVEEDLIKCLAPTRVGDFALKGSDLRAAGLNRIGNMLVPNSNYCAFEDWVMPLLDAMKAEQEGGERGEGGGGGGGEKNDNGDGGGDNGGGGDDGGGKKTRWTPSTVIARLGREIGDPSSFCYWAARNGIPVFCPALTDGSLGDMLYFHSYKNPPGLSIDIVADVRRVNDEALKASPRKTGLVILGGGLPKHHVCNANLMRNGADFAVFVSTAQEFDGSDSGARPDEAVSWGKIRADARPVNVHCDATIAFPLLVSQTFAKVPAGETRHPAGSWPLGVGVAGGGE